MLLGFDPPQSVGLPLLGALMFAVPGCSFTTLPQEQCDSTEQCRSAFGQGSICGEQGLCEVFEPGPRCDSLYPQSVSLPVDPGETLLLASLFNYNNETHRARARSARLAVTQVNDVGGLEGRAVAILECNSAADATLDTLTQDEATSALAESLSRDIGLAVIIGPSSSDRTALAYEAASPYGTLVVSPSATSPALTPLDGLVSTEDDPGLLWRTAGPDDLQGAVIAEDMQERGVVSAAVIHSTGAYGEGLADAFQEAFGGEVVRYPFGNSSARDAATAEAGASSVQEVLFISSEVEDIAAFLNSASGLGSYDGDGVFLTDAAANRDVLTQAAGASSIFPQVRLSKPLEPEGVVYDSFVASYRATYGGDDVSTFSYTAHSFDATWLSLYGAAWSLYQEGQVSGIGIARGFRHVSSGVGLELKPASWSTAKASFEVGRDLDIVGASGALDYDPESGETAGLIGVLVISPDGMSFEEAP